MLSGHCAHSLSCERWRTGCGHCPDLTIYPAIRRDATARNWRRKRQIYATARLNVATPSRWLMRKVEDSMLAPTVVDARVVPNGVDLDRFRPGDHRAARAMLGIDQTAWVILTVGIGIRDSRWKDYATLREAVGRITACARDQRMVVLALGEQGPSERVGQVEIRFVPFQSERNVVVDYYRAADVYVHAAHVDTFPTSVLEALACGTPVVATRVGGIPEQVDDGQTGFLVAPRDPEPLAGRTLQLLRDADLRRAIGRSASETAQRRFGLAKQVDAYLGWYQELAQAARVRGWYAAAR
jgi:glycosyltransferase involved in cell wall biosynthesis